MSENRQTSSTPDPRDSGREVGCALQIHDQSRHPEINSSPKSAIPIGLGFGKWSLVQHLCGIVTATRSCMDVHEICLLRRPSLQKTRG